MASSTLELIKMHMENTGVPSRFPPASIDSIRNAELILGFQFPPLLRECYLQIGNGGFGPGYGIVGVEGGQVTEDIGNVIDLYNALKKCAEWDGKQWKNGLLPFCDWGCLMYSCVDCNDPQYCMYMREEHLAPQSYNLGCFFRMWIDGVDILTMAKSEQAEIEWRNPFTGKTEKRRLP